MKFTKKLLAVVLAALMLFTVLPFAFAVPVTGTVGEDGVLTIACDGAMDDFGTNPPAWRAEAAKITSIVIEDGVTSIGAYAFKDLIEVTSVTLPASVASIGAYAFANCKKLESIEIPANSTVIDRGTFSNCEALTSVIIPENVETICSYAFSNSGLTEITLPMSVKTLEKYAFSGCEALKKITIKNNKCNIVSGSLPPATPAGSEEAPVTIYTVYNSNGDNYAIANNYAIVHIADENKPTYETPDTIQEVIVVSEQNLKETKFGAFLRRLFELLGLQKKETPANVEGGGSGSGSGSGGAAEEKVVAPLNITGPGAELGNLIMKTSFASIIMTLREAFASLFGNFKLSL